MKDDNEQEEEKTAVISNVLSIPEKYVTKKILRDFTTNLVYYFGGGEEKLTDDIKDDYDGSLDLEVQGFRRNREKGTYDFYLGRMDLLKKHFGDFFIIDERSDVRMSDYARENLHLKEGFEFRPKQREVIEEWLKHKRGILKSPARFGKTICMGCIALKLKRKTLIIANQSELLNQWEKEFRSFVSNVNEISTKKHPIIGHLKDFDRDVPKYDILLSSWQIWNVNRGMLRKYSDAFGLILCDEIHRCNAECPKEVISRFKARYKGGVTATPERKDGREVYCEYIVGPVTAEGIVEQMKCVVVPTRTGLCPPPVKNNFTKLITRYCNMSERNMEIVNLAVDCANRGDYVVIGTDRVDHCEELAKMIEKRGVPAAAFHSKCKRKKVMDDAKSGKVRVTIAMRSMLTGINIPRWNVYFNILPISNPPSYYQMFSRVRTVVEGKKNAYIYDFIDEDGVCWGSYRKRCNQYDDEGFTYASQLKLRELERKDSDIEDADEEDKFQARRKKAQVKKFYNMTRDDEPKSGALFD